MSTFRFTKNNLLLTDIVPSMPQLLDNAKPLQTRTSEPVVPLETTNKNSDPPPPYASELSDSEFAAHAFFAIGCLLWEGEKGEKALAVYDTAIRLQPDYAEVYNNRGNIKSGLGTHDAALEDYNEAIRLNPNFAEAYSNRGAMKFRLGKHAAALTDLNEAIRLQPDFMNAYINCGIAQSGLNNIDEAKTDLQKALALAEQQENIDAKAFVEKELQQLNQAASKQNHKQPRRGGQWKEKVKIAEDFDELPESFITSFDAEEEEI